MLILTEKTRRKDPFFRVIYGNGDKVVVRADLGHEELAISAMRAVWMEMAQRSVEECVEQREKVAIAVRRRLKVFLGIDPMMRIMRAISDGEEIFLRRGEKDKRLEWRKTC